ADAGHAVLDIAGGAVHEPRENEALAVAQFYGRASGPGAERRNAEALDDQRIGIVEFADFGAHFQHDAVVVEHRCRHRELNTEFLILDGYRAVPRARLRYGNGNFAAGEKLRVLAASHQKRRLREKLREVRVAQSA